MTFCNEDRTQGPSIESRYREKHMSQETVSEGGSLGELDGENAPELLWDEWWWEKDRQSLKEIWGTLWTKENVSYEIEVLFMSPGK